jgi:hypothetical protein
MAIFYSPSAGGFYSPDYHSAIPSDAVEITAELHAELIAGNSAGKTIAPDANGIPQLVDPPIPTAEETLAAERAQMNPNYTAFRFAMRATPAAGYAHLLDRVTQTVAVARSADPFADIVIWSESVTRVVRMHPDMTSFATAFDLTPESLDDLCRLALQIEAGS